VRAWPGDATPGEIDGGVAFTGGVGAGTLTGVIGRLGSEVAEFGAAALALVAVTVHVINWLVSAEVSV
jgi:hypothetical protein